MTSHTPHRTPLRRVSQGSLFALSRSGVFPDAPHGLGFLTPAISELADETDTLLNNVEGMRNLTQSLATFNESFASWLYVMDMNALTVDWPEAPNSSSMIMAQRRAEKNALEALEATRRAREEERRRQAHAEAEKTMMSEANTSSATAANMTTTSGGKTVIMKKKGGPKAKLTNKEKKERLMELEKIITTLPLEFRGSDPNLRRNMEGVIEGLWDAKDNVAKLADLIKQPELPQARVNKCLIALVNRKIVQKDSSTGTVLYYWKGLPS